MTGRSSCHTFELLQEPHIALDEQAHVGDAVLEHGHSFDPQAERKPRVAFAVVPAILQDLRVDYAGAEQLDPPVAAGSTPDAVADEARHGDLRAGFDERE